MNKRLLIIPFVALILFSANVHSSTSRASIETRVAISNAGNPEKVARIIKITQVDNMFLPAEIAVTAGETVKFVIKNGGSRKHEMLIAPMADLKKYAKMRRNLSEGNNPEPDFLLQLEPGEEKELVWQFIKEGAVEFACLLPGHFKTMHGIIFVEKK